MAKVSRSHQDEARELVNLIHGPDLSAQELRSGGALDLRAVIGSRTELRLRSADLIVQALADAEAQGWQRAIETAKQLVADRVLCPADEKYDNEEARKIGEGTAHNLACQSLIDALSLLPDAPPTPPASTEAFCERPIDMQGAIKCLRLLGHDGPCDGF